MSFTPETITIQVPQKEYLVTEPNLVMYDESSNVILGIGESQEKVHEVYQTKKQEFPAELRFKPVFDPENKETDWELTTIQYYADRSLMKLYRLPYPPSIVWYDFDLWITNYGKWDTEKKQKFEYRLQGEYNAHILKINGQEVSISFSKRILAIYSWKLAQLLPFVILFLAVWLQQSLTAILAGVIVAGLAWVLSLVIWLICAKHFLLSATYLKYYLPELRKSMVFQRFFSILVNRFVEQ